MLVPRSRALFLSLFFALIWALVWLTLSTTAAAAQTARGGIQGTVTDPSQKAVPGATITATDLITGATATASTDLQGGFRFTGLAPHRYQLAVAATGFTAPAQQVAVEPGQNAAVLFTLALPAASQTVMVRSGAVPGATVAPSQQEVFDLPQTERVLDREQITALSPVAGSAQILSMAPGVNVTGYGNTGATKSTITLNGVQQGWGGYGGFTTAGELGITFDGIPVADAATGLWQSNMFPEGSLINSTSVTYGPGDPAQRWYTNVGGGVEFTPLQPANHAHFSLSQTYGSYNQEETDFDLTSGVHDGWSAVIAGGHGSGDSFRQGIGDGFTNPNHDMELYGKAIKQIGNGNLQFGAFSSDSAGYRPQVIPIAENPEITVTGAAGAPTYSQASSGFYSTLPFASYNKYDANLLNLFWGKLNLALDPTTTLQGQAWYERINRLHDRLADVYSLGPQQDEWNNPYTKMFGDRLEIGKVVGWNDVLGGGYFIHAPYNSHNNFYNPADGGSNLGVANAGGKIRSSLFNQDEYSVFAQDRISLPAWLVLTPGIGYFDNHIGYSDQVLQDFAFAPGVNTLPTHCLLNGQFTSTPGDLKIQSSNCDAAENASGVEPSFSLAVHPAGWLNVYGGFSEELKTPEVGGGGGLFQGVDPSSYHLARAEYSQAGVKVHFDEVGPVRRLLAGVSYFHLMFVDQELDIGLANGDSLAASASSLYNGVNAFFDADPTSALHFFMNSTFERTHYTNYVINQSYDANGNLLPGSLPYNGLPVSYVPDTILNLGSYYTIPLSENVAVQPRIWYQYTGQQTIFDNTVGAPSTRTMPTFGTVNLGVNVPLNHFNVRLTALNLFNKQYNQFVYISSGGYFGTTDNGYLLAYPGAPFSMYATVSFRF